MDIKDIKIEDAMIVDFYVDLDRRLIIDTGEPENWCIGEMANPAINRLWMCLVNLQKRGAL